jgi:hypothetical protein
MFIERLEVSASGLSFVMSTFPVLIGQKEEKEPNSKKKKEEETKILEIQKEGRKANREEKTQHN